ncbi:alpha/beta hydrolase [Ktedonobacter sp. SOSP1-85]|uniref:alpha/beta fold hydrolase n=1 Tax=Ktedonobacter sp. SOSP1-85 TaxID=2778367 RepID=UPI0019166CC9|nr:alpha/beta hydrolase [Ktedonobacter sp. SOSP1-85]GHO81782.1 alpha/beta hydrolase [Ktedonobacter sp. SOSP1-85]
MRTVISKDDTLIAFDRLGEGSPIILVSSAFNDRSAGAPLAQLLASHFTVFTYDRRGRGDSGDKAPYAVDREIEDLEALIVEAGGSASVFGYSSGAALSLKAAARGVAITKLALYEPPLIVDESRPRPPEDLAAQLAELIAAGRRGEAVELFQTKGVGMPVEVVAQLRHAPFRPALEAMAHTLVYEMTILRDIQLGKPLPTELVSSVVIPTLVVDGGQSPAWMHKGAETLVDSLPKGQHRRLKDQTHDIVPQILAPVLEEFFVD